MKYQLELWKKFEVIDSKNLATKPGELIPDNRSKDIFQKLFVRKPKIQKDHTSADDCKMMIIVLQRLSLYYQKLGCLC